MQRYCIKSLKLFLIVFYAVMFLNLSAFSAKAFLFDTPILEKGDISKLSDEKLIETYIDVVVEVTALKTFYSKGGLTPREYNNFKNILRYKIALIQEITKRGLDIPKTE